MSQIHFVISILIALDIEFKSLVLLEFRASEEYHCSDIKAIVQSIARMVITTINSTRVNPSFGDKSLINEEDLVFFQKILFFLFVLIDFK
jgi:hypothetical protein